MGKARGSTRRGDLIKVAKRIESVRRPPSGESGHYTSLVFVLSLTVFTAHCSVGYEIWVIKSSRLSSPTPSGSPRRRLSPYTSPGFHHCLVSLQQRAAQDVDNRFCSVPPPRLRGRWLPTKKDSQTTACIK